MITKMTKYSFILLSGGNEAFLKRLQELNLVDITRSRKPVDEASSAMLEEASRIKKAISVIKKADFSKDEDGAVIADIAESTEIPDEPVSCALETVLRIERLHSEHAALLSEAKKLAPWGDFDREKTDALASAGYEIKYYCCPKKKFDPDWASACALEVIWEEGDSLWFVTVGADGGVIPLESVPAPEHSSYEVLAQAAAVEGSIVDAKALLLKLKDCLPLLQEEYRKAKSSLDLYLAGSAGEQAAENMITVFTGFAPSENDASLCAEFDKMDIVYFKEAAVEEDNPPIKLKNNKFARMFEVLTKMYGMPVYSEFDPTPVLGPFFLLFFAMCLGDAGYGILLIIIGLLLKKMSGGMASLAPLVTTLGIGTVVVGFFLGTLFGIPLPEAAWVPDALKKCMITGEIAGFAAPMVLALGIGVFHICFAMTVKAICYTKRFGFKATVSTWAWLILFLGAIIIGALALLGAMSSEVTKWAVIAVGVISALGIFIFNVPGRNPLINIGAGLWDTYNMATGLLGDVLSYLRLYALGLAGGMLGDAFNDLGLMVMDGVPVPGLDWLCFGLIVLLGHALNLAMSCLGAFVHPLRLTFVEYFKNSGYEGSGNAYNPLTVNDNN